MTEPNYSYQPVLIDQCWEHLQASGRAVLAAGCGAGKTRMAVALVLRHLQAVPAGRVLILAHGLRELRDQMSGALAQGRVTHAVLGKRGAVDAQVHVALPHSMKQPKQDQYTLIVVDEAHQFYDAPMVRRIVAASPGAHQLLLTASHGEFNKSGQWPIVALSQLELLNHGVIMDPIVELATTKLDFRKHLNDDGNLRQEFVFGQQHLTESLMTLMQALFGKLTDYRRTDPERFAAEVIHAPNLGFAAGLKRLGKTMIACHNQQTAGAVAEFFAIKKVNVALSSSNFDPDSEELRRFKSDADCPVLVVVNRGVLGFDIPELENVIDMTGSENVDRVYQLLGRCLRYRAGKQPVFLKLAPEMHVEWFEYVLQSVLWLAHPENYLGYHGDYKNIGLLVKAERSHVEIAKRLATGKITNPTKSGVIRIPSFGEMLDIFQRLKWSKGGDLSGYCWTTLSKVAAAGRGADPVGKKEQLLSLLRNKQPKPHQPAKLAYLLSCYTSPGSVMYDRAFSEKIHRLDEAVYPTAFGWFGWTRTKCHNSAVRFASKGAWHQGHSAAYVAALKNGWLDECTAHMPSLAETYASRGAARRRPIRCRETGEVYAGAVVAAQALNLTRSGICQVLAGRNKSTGGLSFEYVDQE